jgi:hypothetical protein
MGSDRLLFLDVDGVLNGQTNGIEPELVARLNRIVEMSGCKVVVSSTWRLHYELPILQSMLNAAGFTGKLAGRTPKYMSCTEHLDAGWECDQAHRGHEIKTYLRNAYPDEQPTIVILDDGGDMEPYGERLVQTQYDVGLEDRHIERSLKMFEQP